MSPPIRIILVEDNEALSRSWCTLLSTEPDLEILASFSSVESALSSGSVARANIVLLDIGLPGMSGIAGVREFLRRNSRISVLIVSAHEDDEHIFAALENGAVGYLSKSGGPEYLVQAIRTLVAGGSPMTPGVARRVVNSFHASSQSSGPGQAQLSDREREVLLRLAEGKSFATIGREIFLSVDGVGYHVRHIYEKLQVNSRGAAVKEGIQRRLIRLFR